MRVVLTLFWMLVCAVSAQAGAWPREAGQVFVAYAADDTRQQIYAEYGWRQDWTLGMDISMPRGRKLPDVTSFVHYHVWQGSGGAVLSAGLAAEMRETVAAATMPRLKGLQELAVRAGLFWGKGFGTDWGDGWLGVDAQVEQVLTTDWLEKPRTMKLDLTLGFKPTDRVMLMMQAQGARRVGDAATWRLEPSFAYAIGKANVVVSPSANLKGPRDRKLKLALWLTF